MTKREAIRAYKEACEILSKAHSSYDSAKSVADYLWENYNVRLAEASSIECEMRDIDPDWSQWEELKGYV